MQDAIVKDSDFAEQESWLEQVVADVSSHYESSRSTGQQGGRASKTKEFGASDQMVEALLRSRKQNRSEWPCTATAPTAVLEAKQPQPEDLWDAADGREVAVAVKCSAPCCSVSVVKRGQKLPAAPPWKFVGW